MPAKSVINVALLIVATEAVRLDGPAAEAMMAQTAAEADAEFWGTAIPAAIAAHSAFNGRWLAEADADANVARWLAEADADANVDGFWNDAVRATASHVSRNWLAEAAAEADADVDAWPINWHRWLAETDSEADVDAWPINWHRWLAETDSEADVDAWPINWHRWLAETDSEANVDGFWGSHLNAGMSYATGGRWLAEAEAAAGSKMPMEWLKKAGKNLWENRDEIAEGLEQGAENLWENRDEIAEGLEQGADWAEEFAGSAYDTAAPVVANVVDEVKSRFSGWLAEHGEEAM
jgi:hypothetical protein